MGIRIENTAAIKFFKGNAQKLKLLEVTQASLQNNSKVILTEKGIKPQILIIDYTYLYSFLDIK